MTSWHIFGIHMLMRPRTSRVPIWAVGSPFSIYERATARLGEDRSRRIASPALSDLQEEFKASLASLMRPCLNMRGQKRAGEGAQRYWVYLGRVRPGFHPQDLRSAQEVRNLFLSACIGLCPKEEPYQWTGELFLSAPSSTTTVHQK